VAECLTERVGWQILPATAAGRALGSFPLGSTQSRAAARALFAARKEREKDKGIGVLTGSFVDGKRVNLSGLAETIRAARLKCQNGELHGSDSDQEYSESHNEGTLGRSPTLIAQVNHYPAIGKRKSSKCRHRDNMLFPHELVRVPFLWALAAASRDHFHSRLKYLRGPILKLALSRAN
jgi:hypothetical protein